MWMWISSVPPLMTDGTGGQVTMSSRSCNYILIEYTLINLLLVHAIHLHRNIP